MIANLNNTRFAPENPKGCVRQDGRDLTQEWLAEKRQAGLSAKFVATTEELRSVNISQTDHIMGERIVSRLRDRGERIVSWPVDRRDRKTSTGDI